jgi:signal transduction histidine kinase
VARLTSTLARHIGLAVIVLHAFLLPLLYYGVDYSVRSSHEDMFVNHVRGYSKTLADEIEAGAISSRDEDMTSFLDSLALGGEVTFAEFIQGGRVLRSSLLPVTDPGRTPPEDYAFGRGLENVYFVSTELVVNGDSATLRLGFDETPTLEGISQTRRGVLVSLGAYMVAIMLSAWLFSFYLARPLKELRAVSRRIASGDFSRRLDAHSSIQEVRDLAADLETMRGELVGVNSRLAQQMAEHSVLEARLRQKQRLETVGTLAGGVAHEFNNVLVPITLYTEMALDSIGQDHAAHADLQRVMSAVRRATSVVGKVLTFSRHLDSRPSSAIDIAPAVDEGLRLFTALRPRNIEIVTAIAPDCLPVDADQTLIVQMVMNLCTNAYQAMDETGGTLRVALRNVDSASDNLGNVAKGQYVELTVADTGSGMDEATVERIFEPFFTNREVGKGTGLGLSVVHGIVTSMGATINVHTILGKGTTFQVLIPAAVAPAQPTWRET